ncbi:hypothetical protein Trydic_g7010 [Trypoxylus dichotomus]
MVSLAQIRPRTDRNNPAVAGLQIAFRTWDEDLVPPTFVRAQYERTVERLNFNSAANNARRIGRLAVLSDLRRIVSRGDRTEISGKNSEAQVSNCS